MTLLPLVPILQMAWAEGGVSQSERDLIVRFARSRGIAEGTAADLQLTSWMASRPGEAVFARAGRLIRAVLDSGADPDLNANDIEAAMKIVAGTARSMGLEVEA